MDPVTLLKVGRLLWAHRRKIYGLAAAAGIALVSVALVFFTVIVGGTPRPLTPPRWPPRNAVP